MAALNRRGGCEQLILVWIKGPGGWTQRQVRDLGDLKLTVTDLGGATEGDGWLLKGGKVLDAGPSRLHQGHHVHV